MDTVAAAIAIQSATRRAATSVMILIQGVTKARTRLMPILASGIQPLLDVWSMKRLRYAVKRRKQADISEKVVMFAVCRTMYNSWMKINGL